MKTLWFKQIYVTSILDGSKHITVRPPSTRLPDVGEVVAASVGPRRPFAHLLIEGKRVARVQELTPEHRKDVEALYGVDQDLVELRFSVQEMSALHDTPSS